MSLQSENKHTLIVLESLITHITQTIEYVDFYSLASFCMRHSSSI